MEFDGCVHFHYDDTPKTVNKGGGGSRGHWSKGHKEKAMWEGIYCMCFLQAKLPRPLEYVQADIVLGYTRPNTKRDPENFRHPVAKPLADALVKAGYLSDDDPEHFSIGIFEISRDKLDVPGSLVKSRIDVTLHYRFPRAASAPSGLAAPATESDTGSARAPEAPGARDDRTGRAPGVRV
jgi:hypothetical protein